MAGQVSVGLTPGDGQPERAVAGLLAIGLMLRTATDNELVHAALSLAEHQTITRTGEGSWLIRARLPEA